jgi:hypothetical protein
MKVGLWVRSWDADLCGSDSLASTPVKGRAMSKPRVYRQKDLFCRSAARGAH